jgi:hypothetical protein
VDCGHLTLDKVAVGSEQFAVDSGQLTVDSCTVVITQCTLIDNFTDLLCLSINSYAVSKPRQISESIRKSAKKVNFPVIRGNDALFPRIHGKALHETCSSILPDISRILGEVYSFYVAISCNWLANCHCG